MMMFAVAASAQDGSADGLPQQWTSENFGYGFSLPPESLVKYNKLGSAYNVSGGSEKVNFMIRGGKGAITIEHFTEQRMVPDGYQLRDDSLHYYDQDSVGTNGKILRRNYVMNQQVVQLQILVTPSGEAEILPLVPLIFASFRAPEQASFTLESWRYGRDPSEYQRGRYEHNRDD